MLCIVAEMLLLVVTTAPPPERTHVTCVIYKAISMSLVTITNPLMTNMYQLGTRECRWSDRSQGDVQMLRLEMKGTCRPPVINKYNDNLVSGKPSNQIYDGHGSISAYTSSDLPPLPLDLILLIGDDLQRGILRSQQ